MSSRSISKKWLSLKKSPFKLRNSHTERMQAAAAVQEESHHHSIFNSNNYIEYQPGNLNVIITIPHGGNLRPSHIPVRDAGRLINDQCVYAHIDGKKDKVRCPVRTKNDMYTRELGLLIADHLNRLSHLRPHIVINHLHRSRLDVNTDVHKGTFNVPEAVQAWKDYHGFIETAKGHITGCGSGALRHTHTPGSGDGVSPSGLLLDIHGQSHPEEWIELGYTLSAEKLSAMTYQTKETSICSLANHMHETLTIQELIFGSRSFGGLLSSRGYKSVPSPQYPSPGNGAYYNGGYTTRSHGSHNGGSIDAIQVESPRFLRTKERAGEYAENLAHVILEFTQLYSMMNPTLVRHSATAAVVQNKL